MDQLINDKISSAQNILKELGLPEAQRNKISALTFLALANQKPEDDWQKVSQKSMRLSKDIMEFVNKFYRAEYAANSRESFRKLALKPFVDYNIAVLNPDDPNLSTNSANTHYALSDLVVNTLQKYNTDDWSIVKDNFRKFVLQFSKKQNSNILLRDVSINNFKSIVNNKIELGRFNVFIGANGSGKSNLLEVLACAGAAKANDLSLDGLNSRGVRYALPDLMLSSFAKQDKRSVIDISLTFQEDERKEELRMNLSPLNRADSYTRWVDLAEESFNPLYLKDYFEEVRNNYPGISGDDLIEEFNKLISRESAKKESRFDQLLSDFAIYDINTSTLRGIANTESRKTPLGINGEGLDLLISNFNKEDRKYINNCRTYFNWLGDIISDKRSDPKLKHLKPGRSISNLYFTDNFMDVENNTFSAENSNEGILHVLFYLSLFISDKTPRIFAIDNIETALNPRLCRVLIKELVSLSKENGKQVLITTHNPAILDGLNLIDNEQRLFEVSRSSKGFTKIERIQFKPNLEDKPSRLSDMWVKGLLGGIPTDF